jgi:hypothetical protein
MLSSLVHGNMLLFHLQITISWHHFILLQEHMLIISRRYFCAFLTFVWSYYLDKYLSNMYKRFYSLCIHYYSCEANINSDHFQHFFALPLKKNFGVPFLGICYIFHNSEVGVQSLQGHGLCKLATTLIE